MTAVNREIGQARLLRTEVRELHGDGVTVQVYSAGFSAGMSSHPRWGWKYMNTNCDRRKWYVRNSDYIPRTDGVCGGGTQ